jgi:putative transcriptional regulator
MIRVNLVELLRQRGISQRELARRIGTHPNVVSRIAREQTGGISYELLNGLCRELRCRPGDLLAYEDDSQLALFQE